jgi:hypothetical protein
LSRPGGACDVPRAAGTHARHVNDSLTPVVIDSTSASAAFHRRRRNIRKLGRHSVAIAPARAFTRRAQVPAPLDLVSIQPAPSRNLKVIDTTSLRVGDAYRFQGAISECSQDQAGSHPILRVVSTDCPAFAHCGRQRITLAHREPPLLLAAEPYRCMLVFIQTGIKWLKQLSHDAPKRVLEGVARADERDGSARMS